MHDLVTALLAIESPPLNVYNAIVTVVTILGTGAALYAGLANKKADHKHEESAAERKLAADLLVQRAEEVKSLRAEMQQFGAKLIEQASEVGSLRSEVKLLRERDREQGIRIGELMAQLAECSNQLTVRNAELGKERLDHERTRSQCSEWKDEYDKLLQQNELLAEKIRGFDGRVKTLEGTITDLESKIARLRTELAEALAVQSPQAA